MNPWLYRALRLGSLLAALAASPAAHAVTSVTVDGHPDPVTLVVGETVTVRFDVSKAAGGVNFRILRDLAGTGKYDPADPQAVNFPYTDGGQDTDPTPGKVAFAFTVPVDWPAGRYIAHVEDNSDRSTFDSPGWSIAPKPEAQAISGRVAVVSDANPAGTPPQDAVIWAYADFQTPVASASIRADGSYLLPVPPGTYIVFAEWFGNLHSQRQVVNLVAAQQVGNVDLPLLQGQEVAGTIKDGGTPVANAPVQALSVGGRLFSARSFADGSYVLVLPNGQYRITAPGGSETVTVADQPVDGVDFPPPAAGTTPAPGTIVTAVGNGISGSGGDGRRATAARLNGPGGLAADKAGNLYVGDNTAHRVRKVDATTGLITTVAGSGTFDVIRGLTVLASPAAGFSGDGGPATAAHLNAPQLLATDAAGNLYITDTRNQRVRKVDPNGIITTVAGSGPVGLNNGGFGGDGGPATSALLNVPRGVAVDAVGNLYITDNRNGRVRKVDPNGIITTVAGGGTAPVTNGAKATEVALAPAVAGLAVDRADNLFLVSPGDSRILKVSPTGTISTVAGTGKAGFSGDGGPATAAEIANPYAIAADSAGNVYFSDADNHRIRKISVDGIISTVAGSGATGAGNGGFAGDNGPATAARLNAPQGVAIDAAGNLLFTETGNRRVRKVIGIAAPGLVGGAP
jgi:hypothetical protein